MQVTQLLFAHCLGYSMHCWSMHVAWKRRTKTSMLVASVANAVQEDVNVSPTQLHCIT